MCDKESYQNAITWAWDNRDDPQSVLILLNNLIISKYDYFSYFKAYIIRGIPDMIGERQWLGQIRKQCRATRL